ncbi:MAG: hypothetical protein ACKVP7_24755 [Hyphomicrobiaceae bacterium]
MISNPPPRAPHWIAMEQGWSTDVTDCARLAIEAICLAAQPPASFALEGLPVMISDVTCGKGGGHVAGKCAGIAFALDLAARSDGWVEGVLSIHGREALSFFLERPYEEYEFFPPGHSGEAPPMDAPGRISKRLTWAQVRAADWPWVVRAGYLTVEAVEA